MQLNPLYYLKEGCKMAEELEWSGLVSFSFYRFPANISAFLRRMCCSDHFSKYFFFYSLTENRQWQVTAIQNSDLQFYLRTYFIWHCFFLGWYKYSETQKLALQILSIICLASAEWKWYRKGLCHYTHCAWYFWASQGCRPWGTSSINER